MNDAFRVGSVEERLRREGAYCLSLTETGDFYDAMRTTGGLMLEAAAEIKRYAEREALFAQMLHVADGGVYRADWEGAIRRVVRERDEARRALAAVAAPTTPTRKGSVPSVPLNQESQE